MEHAGPGAPHGAWPLGAADFGTRGCRGPACSDHCNDAARVTHSRFSSGIAPRFRRVTSYEPEADGQPDPGEVVWGWVPFEEDPSQGKDRPVLLIGRKEVGGVDYWAGLMLTSKDHDRDAEDEARYGRHWMDVGRRRLGRRAPAERGAAGPAGHPRATTRSGAREPPSAGRSSTGWWRRRSASTPSTEPCDRSERPDAGGPWVGWPGPRGGRVRRSWIVVSARCSLSARAVAGCTGGDDDPGPARPSVDRGRSPRPTSRFGVWGAKQRDRRLPGRRRHLQRHNDEATVKIKAYGTHDDLMAALDSGEVPDVFLVSRGDLADLQETKISTSPSATCSTTATSTSATATRGRRSRPSPATASCSACPTASRRWSSTTTPSSSTSRRWPTAASTCPPSTTRTSPRSRRWTLEQFQAAAEYASRPRRGIAGFYIAPTLRGPGAVHLLRRRQDLRRRRRADLAGLLLRRHEVGPREGAADAARPEAVADAGDAVREDAPGVVP